MLYSNKGNTIFRNHQYPAPLNLEIFEAREIKDMAHYLDVPLLAGVKVLESGRLSVVPAAGLVGSFLLTSSREVTFPDGQGYTTSNTSVSNGFLLGGAIELGINYQLSEKMQLGLAPYYRTGSDFRNRKPFRGAPSSFGSSLDLRFCL